MDYSPDGLDLAEVLKRALKYLVEGGAVALAAFYIPQGKRLALQEVLMLAVTAAATFAILDLYAPAISSSARLGAGFGVGGNLVGFPK